MGREIYFKRCLFDVISSIATATGSRAERLDKSFFLILHCLNDDKYIENMQEHTKNMVIELREMYKKIQDTVPQKHLKKYGTLPQDKHFRLLQNIHYTQAEKMIYLIINLYQNI